MCILLYFSSSVQDRLYSNFVFKRNNAGANSQVLSPAFSGFLLLQLSKTFTFTSAPGTGNGWNEYQFITRSCSSSGRKMPVWETNQWIDTRVVGWWGHQNKCRLIYYKIGAMNGSINSNLGQTRHICHTTNVSLDMDTATYNEWRVLLRWKYKCIHFLHQK